MLLEGSCHCGAVRFSVESRHPTPYMRCYCSICRKTSGGGGYAINLAADARTLEVHGRDHLKVYQAVVERDGVQVHSDHQRHFCGECGCHLWAHNKRWPDHLHPVAGAVDTPLPQAPTLTHVMLGSKSSWVPVGASSDDEQFEQYPDKSIADWHELHGMSVD